MNTDRRSQDRALLALRATLRFALLLCWPTPLVLAAPPVTAMEATAPIAPDGATAADLALGRAIYLSGRGLDGRRITAVQNGSELPAEQVPACVRCHRRSGFGAVEGDIQIPPISGPALFNSGRLKDRVVVTMDVRRGRQFNPAHAAYDAATLQAAIVGGLHVSGRPLLPLMPRYRLQPEEMRGLAAYLRSLSSEDPPGLEGQHLYFATVITPDVDPARRAAFVATLQAAFDQKAAGTLPGRRHMVAASEMILRSERHWDLQVWQLSGPAATWSAQLDALQAARPVFALVSGLGGGDWAPVQAWSEQRQVPCWFPIVDAPPVAAAQDFYTLHFTRGVYLEADVLAGQLQGCAAGGRLQQWVGRDLAAEAGAAALAARARQAGCTVQNVPMADAAAPMSGVESGPSDMLVLWLRPAALAALGPPPAVAQVFASGVLAGEELAPLPQAWRAVTQLVFRHQVPAARAANLATFRSWLAVRGLPLSDEGLQSDVFFAMSYLQNTLSDLLDNVHRDALIERGEAMLTRREAQRAEEETVTRMSGHPPARAVAEASRLAPGAIYGADPWGPLAQRNTPAYLLRTGTTAYPRLSLASGQRFASRGAYLSRLPGAPADPPLPTEADWHVPVFATPLDQESP